MAKQKTTKKEEKKLPENDATEAKKATPKKSTKNTSKAKKEVEVPIEVKSPQTKDKKADKTNEIKAPRILSPDEVGFKIGKKKEKDKKKKEEKAVKRIKADIKTGLTSEQVAKRVEEGLSNKVENKNTKSYANIFISNIFTFFNLLCFAVAGCLIAVGAFSDLMFLIILFANMFIGIFQEIKAKKTIEKISLVTAPSASVIRDGVKREIPVEDLVLDDIILFSLGKQICADCDIIDGEVEVNESLLTGESVAIKKKVGDKLFSGSFIVSGRCTARVDKIGNESYTAQLSEKAKQYKKPNSELLKSLKTIILCIGFIIIPLGGLMFYNNYYVNNLTLQFAIKKTAGSMIGMIPAGMFLLTSLALATGVIKLARKRTLVQDLYSIEMLARTDVLCLDKTGTITDGTMKVNTVIQLGSKSAHAIGDIMGSMLTALNDNNQTSRALASHFGYSKEFTKSVTMPFSSEKKLSAVTFKNGETYAFGAPEFVYKTKDANLDKMVKQYAYKGFRVLLLVKCDGKIENDKLPAKRTPVALIVIEDHIREDAFETIKWFRDNGVQIKIISGDNPITVSEVSKRVGVDKAELFVSLEGMSETQVIEAADNYTVFGRVSPEQKCILVKALKSKGHKVAMTGDGVNDILALKEADCSIAMASGSEATRNVSHLVLLDSNFSSMPSVVAEGRRVVNNVQKSASLFLMKTFFTIFVSIFCLIMSIEYPFNTKQIMLLEAFVIGIPSFCLALQPNSEKIKGKFLPRLISKSLPGAIIFTFCMIACFTLDRIVGTNGQYETMAAFAVTFTGLLVLLNLCKPFDIFRGILFAGVTILTILALAFIPFSFFEFVMPSFQNWLYIIVLVQLSYPLYSTVVRICDKLIPGDDKN